MTEESKPRFFPPHPSFLYEMSMEYKDKKGQIHLCPHLPNDIVPLGHKHLAFHRVKAIRIFHCAFM